jgi:hypothetical protein
MLVVGCFVLVERAVVTPLLRGRFQGHRTSNRARDYRPAKRRNHRPPKSTRARRPNFSSFGRGGRIRPARHEQTGLPGGRPRMTAGDLSAQSLILPPGTALPMGTVKSTSSQRLMGMRCDPGPAFFGLTCEREHFMPIRGMSGRVCSRDGELTGSLVFGGYSGNLVAGCGRKGKELLE